VAPFAEQQQLQQRAERQQRWQHQQQQRQQHEQRRPPRFLVIKLARGMLGKHLASVQITRKEPCPSLQGVGQT
jgi:hypothetical protein